MRNRYKITEEIKSEVKLLLQQEKRVVVKERLTAVHMYINGMIQEDVAKALGRNRGFVSRAVKNYISKGIEGVEEQRGGDRRSELTIEEREELGHIINTSYPINAKGWDGKIIVDLIKHKYGVCYSRETVYHILKKLNISYKKAKKVDPKKSEIKIEDWKKDIKKI
jgi:transposase